MTKQRSSLTVMLALITLLKPLIVVMIIAIIMGVAGFLAAIFIPTMAGFAIVEILGLPGGISLNSLIIYLTIFAISRGVLRYAEQACNHYIAFKLLALIRDKVFAALRRLAPAKLEGRDKGDLIALITSDIELLEVFYAHTISPICIAIIVSAFMTVFIASYHYLLGLIAFLAYLSVGIVLPYYISRKSLRIAAEHRSRFSELNAYFLDSLRGLREIIQYEHGGQRLAKIKAKTVEMSGWEEQMKGQTANNLAISGFLVLAFTLLMLLTALYLFLRGSVDFSPVIIASIAMSASFGPVLAIANLGSGLSSTIAAGNRVLDILAEEPQIKENLRGEEPKFNGASFAHVDFAYDQSEILKDLNFEIEQGKVTGIIGRSGSGKSTMLKLLMRFWDRDSGRIELGNCDIKQIKTTYLRDLESYVTQDSVLFKDTIANNIRIAKLDASDEEILRACKKASIHSFISRLPQGYQTEVGELGDTLSGGQKQRLALARAFLHDGPLLLLDEPTSNLDSLNEAVILKALKEDEQRTIVLVSHRPSTMTIANRVYSVENGRVS